MDSEQDQPSIEESATILCRHCGLCCMGAVFSYVEVSSEEKKSLSNLGFSIHEKPQNRHFFNLPCRQFHLGVCGIYPDIPGKCSDYRCRLLKRLQKDKIELLDALAIADETIDLALNVSRLMNKSGSHNWKKINLKDRIYKAVRTKPENRTLIRAIKKYLQQLDRDFQDQRLLKEIPKNQQSIKLNIILGAPKEREKN